MTTTVLDYTTPGNYIFTAPNGMSSLVIECWGAGGCGGGCSNNNTACGGGGGGAYSKISSSPSFNFPLGYVTTGSVGMGALTGNTPSPGGDSYILSASGFTICRAKGGGSVNGNTSTGASGGSGGGGVGDIRYSGGNGATGTAINFSGGGGEGSSTSGNGNNSTNSIGGTGTDGGDGGNGINGATSYGSGTGGQWTGGGGGGAKKTTIGTAYYGGAGAHGRIRITYTVENALLCVIDEFL